jgi:hypothetical protein
VLLTKEIAEGGNTAIYTWNQYPAPCSGVEVTNNVATFLRADEEHSGFFNGGGCEPVTLSNNIFGEAAFAILLPEFAGVDEGLLPVLFPLEYPPERSGLITPLTKALIAVAVLGAVGSLSFYLFSHRTLFSRRKSA